MIKETVIQIKNGIMINVNVSAKKIRYVKKISFGILLHVFSKYFDDDSMIRCDETIEEWKTIPTNFNEKKQPVKPNFLYFTCSFINYYCITDVFTLRLLTCSNIYDLKLNWCIFEKAAGVMLYLPLRTTLSGSNKGAVGA